MNRCAGRSGNSGNGVGSCSDLAASADRRPRTSGDRWAEKLLAGRFLAGSALCWSPQGRDLRADPRAHAY